MTELNHELEKGVKERTEELAVANNQLKEQVVERERLYGQARTASRLKDEFLATVSHELRTPLNVIQGNSELLKSENLNVEETREAIDAIYRNSKTQAQIINDLLDVSRIISGKLQLTIEPLDLGQAVQNAIETIKIAAAAKNISVNTEIDASVGPVAADATRLQQVIWNILSNAVKFTPKGGKIQVNLGRDGSRARLQIADTGKGIEPHFLPYVFDRFRQEDSTTTRRYGGLGLGLSIARHIVESHGGTIEAVSEGKSKGA
ncbi:MAG: HAMP domain-containing sensor histidine kinase, partial [Bdellovibrionota bacterium]